MNRQKKKWRSRSKSIASSSILHYLKVTKGVFVGRPMVQIKCLQNKDAIRKSQIENQFNCSWVFGVLSMQLLRIPCSKFTLLSYFWLCITKNETKTLLFTQVQVYLNLHLTVGLETNIMEVHMNERP